MNWSFLIAFGIGLAVYLLFLGILALVKYLKNKKKLEKEVEEYQANVQEQESQAEVIDNKEQDL